MKARLEALHPGSPDTVEKGLEAWDAEHAAPEATLAQVADHIDHLRRVGGVESIGLGADFDGMRGGPIGLEDVSKYPDLLVELLRRGYSDRDVAAIAGGNVLRALRGAEATARRLRTVRPPADPPADPHAHSNGQANSPEGEFVAVAAGGRHTCALDVEAAILCWGLDLGVPPFGRFVEITAGDDFSCARREDGSASCWGDMTEGRDAVPAVPISQIDAGAGHICAIDTHGAAICWGRNAAGQADPPDGPFELVTAGRFAHSCARRADGTAVCWGLDDRGQSTPPGR